MFYKISTMVLASLLLIGAIYWYQHQQIQPEKAVHFEKDNQILISENRELKKQMKLLEDELSKAKQFGKEVLRNTADYLTKYDELMKLLEPVLPVIMPASDEYDDALIFAKEYIKKNMHDHKAILPEDEIAIYLEVAKTDVPSQVIIYFNTYKQQANEVQRLPQPVDVRLGAQKAMLLEKQGDIWKVIDIGDTY